MGIVQRDGLNFYDGLNSDFIAIESNRLECYLKYIKENNTSAISLNNLYYFGENIEFLEDCPFVEKLSITSSSILDYSALGKLKQLKVLTLEEPKGKVDLSNSNSLEELSTELNKNIIGIDKLQNLKVLKLWKYNPKSKSINDLSVLSSLEELQITQSNITSLNGCCNLINLKILELSYLNKLEHLDGMEENSATLKSLRFDSCKKIRNHEYVTCLSGLELLAFDECGEIPSIAFIRKLPQLKSFIFVNTNICDGDLSPCVGLEYVGFLNKKHYSHKSEDFKNK